MAQDHKQNTHTQQATTKVVQLNKKIRRKVEKDNSKEHMTPHYRLWVKLYPSQNSYVEILIPVPQSVTLFGDRSFKEGIHLKMRSLG